MKLEIFSVSLDLMLVICGQNQGKMTEKFKLKKYIDISNIFIFGLIERLKKNSHKIGSSG